MGMLHSVFWSLLFGFFLAASFIVAIPDLTAAAKGGGNSWFNLFNNLPMPGFLKSLLAIGIVIANYICALAGMTSMSRMLFAFARDGGLPGSKAIGRFVVPGIENPASP
jgi:amino acid transporter